MFRSRQVILHLLHRKKIWNFLVERWKINRNSRPGIVLNPRLLILIVYVIINDTKHVSSKSNWSGMGSKNLVPAWNKTVGFILEQRGSMLLEAKMLAQSKKHWR